MRPLPAVAYGLADQAAAATGASSGLAVDSDRHYGRRAQQQQQQAPGLTLCDRRSAQLSAVVPQAGPVPCFLAPPGRCSSRRARHSRRLYSARKGRRHHVTAVTLAMRGRCVVGVLDWHGVIQLVYEMPSRLRRDAQQQLSMYCCRWLGPQRGILDYLYVVCRQHTVPLGCRIG